MFFGGGPGGARGGALRVAGCRPEPHNTQKMKEEEEERRTRRQKQVPNQATRTGAERESRAWKPLTPIQWLLVCSAARCCSALLMSRLAQGARAEASAGAPCAGPGRAEAFCRGAFYRQSQHCPTHALRSSRAVSAVSYTRPAKFYRDFSIFLHTPYEFV